MATAGDTRGRGPQRAFVESLPSSGAVRLSPEESHHLCRTRRVAQGATVVLFDGEGATMRGTLVHADGRAAVVELDAPYPDREPAVRVHIAAAVPEPARADHMIATMAELGVWSYQPTQFERMHPKRIELVQRRGERWTKMTREAAKVNGRSRLMEIREVLRFRELRLHDSIVLDPSPDVPPLASVIRRDASSAMLVIGPEGGLTPGELEHAREQKARLANLGAPVLRIETAALAAAAIALSTPRG